MLEHLNYGKEADSVRSLILENPELPVVIFASTYASYDDETYAHCSDIKAEIGWVLDCDGVRDDRVYTDEDELRDDVAEGVYCDDQFNDLSDGEFDEIVERRMKEYEPFWKKCIVVYVGA